MYSLTGTDIIDLVKNLKPKIVVEIGTYYGGWTHHISDNTPEDTIIYTFQSPHDHKLNHVPKTKRGEYSDIEPVGFHWKDYIKKRFPPEYHSFYDFNLLANSMSNCPKAVCILDTSPPKFKWTEKVDFCTIDITVDFEPTLEQVYFWSKHLSETGVMLVGFYGTKQKAIKLLGEKFKLVEHGDNYLLVYNK